MRFEGSPSENPRAPKDLFENDGKLKGPFLIRANAKEVAESIPGYRCKGFKGGNGWEYYAIPSSMDDDFNRI